MDKPFYEIINFVEITEWVHSETEYLIFLKTFYKPIMFHNFKCFLGIYVFDWLGWTQWQV